MQSQDYKQCGFTIVELVIVILIIGILSAVALPKIFNLFKEAKKNTALSITINLKTAVELLHNKWLAASEPDFIITAEGINIFMGHDYGYPRNVGDTRIAVENMSGIDCVNLWNALLKNPPLALSITDYPNCHINGTCKYAANFVIGSCIFLDKYLNKIELIIAPEKIFSSYPETINYFPNKTEFDGLVDCWINSEGKYTYNKELFNTLEASKFTNLSITDNIISIIESLHDQWLAASKPTFMTIADGIYVYMGRDYGYGYVYGYGWPQYVATDLNAPIREYYVSDRDCLALLNAFVPNHPLAEPWTEPTECTLSGKCKYRVTGDGGMLCYYVDKDNNYISYNKYDGSSNLWLDNEKRWVYDPPLW